MHRIKIVQVTLTLGGVKTYMEHMLNYSNKKYFDYVIIAPKSPALQNFCEEISVRYYPVTSPRSINIFKDISAFFRVVAILKKEKPDILHAHSAKGGFVGRLAAKVTGVKAIYSPHAFSFLSFTGLKRTAFYLLECLTRPITDILLSVSHSEASRAVHEVGYEPEKVKVVLNAIPVNTTLPFRSYNHCDRIGMIGRLTEQKNPLLFLNVAKKLLKVFPHLSFSILGAGLTDNLAATINDFIKDHGLVNNVEILSWGNTETSKIFLENIDVFMLTSVYEGLPFSLVEAMAMGIPCVATKVDGNTDVIHNNENGFACLSVDEFVDKLRLLIQSEDLRRRLGQAGYRYVKEKHDIQQNIKQLEQIYSSVFTENEVPPLQGSGKTVSNIPEYRKVSPGI